MNLDAISEAKLAPATPLASKAAQGRAEAYPEEPATRAAILDAVRVLQTAATGLQFSLDESSGKMIIVVLDAVTKEVLRQIPSPEAMAISRALSRTQSALLQTQV
jgi:flagellar protein FlaG